MHAAVEVDTRQTVAMRLEHRLDLRRIADIRRTFIVDDEVIACGVISIPEDGQRRMGAGVVGVNLIDDDVRTLLDALLEDLLLFGVIVAAAAGNQQDPKRLGSRRETIGSSGPEHRQPSGGRQKERTEGGVFCHG